MGRASPTGEEGPSEAPGQRKLGSIWSERRFVSILV